MNKIVRTSDLPEHSLSVARVMDQAMAPFRLGEEMEEAILIAYQARSLVQRDGDGDLIALKQAVDRPQRWALHCEAHGFIDELPQDDLITTAFNAVHGSITTTKPTFREYKMLAAVMLDGLGLKADDNTAAYVKSLAWLLSDCPPRQYEEQTHPRKRWMPLPAVAAAIRQIWLTRSSDYGKPIPSCDVLDECGRHSNQLINLRGRIANLGSTRQRLVKIVQATEDSYPEDL